MRRHILGVSALVLLAGAVAFMVWPPDTAFTKSLHAACVRVGALCAVVWLAYHELARLPAWIGSVFPVAAVLIALRPKWAIIVIPLVIALMILGRKEKVDSRGR